MRAAILLTLLFASGAVQAESVPLIRENGTFLVPVVINDKISLNFTLDSGASDVSIPADVFSTLARTGTITKSDLLDMQMYTLADGSERRSQRFRIRSLRVGNLVLENVTGSVAPTAGSLLLGQSFLERFRYWSVDNHEHVLILNDLPGAVAHPPTMAQNMDKTSPALGTARNFIMMEVGSPGRVEYTRFAHQERENRDITEK